MGREEEELRFRSAEDQQERWRGQVSGGAKKQNSAPLAPQLSLNAPAGPEATGEDAVAAAQPAPAPRVRFHPDAVAPPTPPQVTIDSRPLLILTCVAAAACIGAFMTRDAGGSSMSRIAGGHEYALTRQQMTSLFGR